MPKKFFFIIYLLIILNSCSSNKETIYEPSIKINPYESYKAGMNAFEKNDYFFASKKFSEAELNFEIPSLAAKSAIMSSYALYGINFYNDAEENLNRYLENYPGDKNVIYAHYLLAVIQFEQIGEEKHDLNPLIKAKKQIDFFLTKYPNSEYAIDLNFKKDLVNNQFAAKELYIAKYYISTQKWIPAINRLKLIVKDYEKTIFIEEALHRLVEIHYHLGLKDEANKYATILGYNYNSGKWFEQSYKILNKNYEKVLKTKIREEKNFLNKIFKAIKLR
tara:strand:- start:69 stop:899 length:831 start_codon:yes stop_codon:yes gene_type:complete